jgi:chaperone modulatory protein CbpM
MIAREEILLRVGIGEDTFAAWCEAGWLRTAETYAEADLARAALIRDMIEAMGVNAEGVEVALSLLDQLHGARRALRQVAAALEALPEPLRTQVLAALASVDAG